MSNSKNNSTNQKTSVTGFKMSMLDRTAAMGSPWFYIFRMISNNLSRLTINFVQ